MLRAVAELTSVGFEGGASASTKSWFYTSDQHFIFESFRSAHGQLKALDTLHFIIEALDYRNELQSAVHLLRGVWTRSRWKSEEAVKHPLAGGSKARISIRFS